MRYALLLVSLLSAACLAPAQPAPANQLQRASIVRVVDGDTIVVLLAGRRERVRYVGINAPEVPHDGQPGQCFGHEATERNAQLVDGGTVALEKDVSEVDRFGRLLRYVYVGEMMVEAELVRGGFARALRYPPDVRHAELLERLEREARGARRGLWGHC